MILSILFVLSLMACESNEQPNVDQMMANSKETGAVSYDLEVQPMEQREPSKEQVVPMRDQAVGRQLIKEGNISFECENVLHTKAAVEEICKSLGAYTSSEGQDSYGEHLTYRQTIRVPSAKFDTLLSHLEKLAIKIESKDISTRDVTEEFIDLDTRLKTKKELEDRYREILKQAHNVQEVLAVEREIGNVRSEIESMEGRLNYLKDRIALSTLTINYYQLVPSNFGFGSKFVNSFSRGWENLLSFLIGIMSLWPFMLLLGLGVGFYMRYKNRKKV